MFYQHIGSDTSRALRRYLYSFAYVVNGFDLFEVMQEVSMYSTLYRSLIFRVSHWLSEWRNSTMGKPACRLIVCGAVAVGKTAMVEQILYGNHNIGKVSVTLGRCLFFRADSSHKTNFDVCCRSSKNTDGRPICISITILNISVKSIWGSLIKVAGLLSLTHRPSGQFLRCNSKPNWQKCGLLESLQCDTNLSRKVCFKYHPRVLCRWR